MLEGLTPKNDFNSPQVAGSNQAKHDRLLVHEVNFEVFVLEEYRCARADGGYSPLLQDGVFDHKELKIGIRHCTFCTSFANTSTT